MLKSNIDDLERGLGLEYVKDKLLIIFYKDSINKNIVSQEISPEKILIIGEQRERN